MLEIATDDKTYRFRLSREAGDEVGFYLELLRQLRERFAPYSDPIAAACVKGSWPGADHPFFRANATESTNIEALFGFLARESHIMGFVFGGLPWFSTDTLISQSKRRLEVTSESGVEEYGYHESEQEIGLSYYTHSIGFFDDSEYERKAVTMLWHLVEPDESVVGSAIDVGGLGAAFPNGPSTLGTRLV